MQLNGGISFSEQFLGAVPWQTFEVVVGDCLVFRGLDERGEVSGPGGLQQLFPCTDRVRPKFLVVPASRFRLQVGSGRRLLTTVSVFLYAIHGMRPEAEPARSTEFVNSGEFAL